MQFRNKILCGDALSVLKTLPDESVHCCVTSPPYWGLRQYIDDDHPDKKFELGLEKTPEEYVAKMVELFREVRRLLMNDGTLWLNLGSSYFGSWGNYGGQNRGDGSQREISNGSSAPNPAYDDLEQWRPPSSFTHSVFKPKDLVPIPWMVAMALQADGWWLRQDIIWSKPAPLPESVNDRCTKSHEYIFLLSKSQTYYYDQESILEPCSHADEAKYDNGLNGHGGGESHVGQGSSTRKFRKAGNKSHKYVDEYESSDTEEHRVKAGLMKVSDKTWEVRNKRSVWTVNTKKFTGAHFATFPPDLIRPCILAGCPEKGTVLDPFMGSGTTAYVAKHNGRNYVGGELNPDYILLANKRLAQHVLNF